MAKTKFFRKIYTGSRELDTIQANVQDAVAEAIRSPIVTGQALTGISIGTSQTTVSHKLGRKPIGFLVIGLNTNAVVYEAAPADEANFYLVASLACTASFWFF